MADGGPITNLLRKIEVGDQSAANQLFALVEKDLLAIAKHCKSSAGVGDDVSTKMLINEAFFRLIGPGETSWQDSDRKKFFGYIAKRIHDLMIDSLRHEGAAKRGGKLNRHDLEAADDKKGPGGLENLDLQLDLRAALLRFQAFAHEEAIIFRLRYLTGCTFDDIAEIMGMSVTTTRRAFEKAQRWLVNELKDYDQGQDYHGK